MAFTPNIPTADESLNDSRPEISGNFQSLREAFSVDFTGDHVDPNDADAGRHWWVRMPDIGADVPPFSADQLAFFVKTVPVVGGTSQIYYIDPVGNQVQVTCALTTGASGRSVPIIGGLCMKVGAIVAAVGVNNLLWNTETGSPFRAATNPLFYTVAMDNTNPSNSVIPGTVSATTFQFTRFGAAGLTVYYLAIGFPA